MLSTSPSEMVLNDDCSLAHHYKYIERLQKVTEKRSPTLASGTAVHYVVELFCLNYAGCVPDEGDLRAHAEECLRDEFRDDDDGGTHNVKKFTPGVTRALSRIPEWVWHASWHVEEDIAATFQLPLPRYSYEGQENGVEVHGRVDMYRTYMQEDVPTLEIIDVKTTKTDPMEYLLWTPQLRIYAAILQQAYPDHQIMYRYLCVPTGVKDNVPANDAWIFTRNALNVTLEEIAFLSKKLSEPPKPRYSRRCSWCAYAPICTQRITGGDVDSMIREEYVVRATAEERKRKEDADINA